MPLETLTLAEVEVLSNGVNVAPQGTATQSSVAWGGVAHRPTPADINLPTRADRS